MKGREKEKPKTRTVRLLDRRPVAQPTAKRASKPRAKQGKPTPAINDQPKDLNDAYDVLVAYGVDPVRLRKLISYRMTPDDWKVIANSPEKILDAFNVLCSKPHLIGAGAVNELIRNRKLPPHRPPKTDEISRLQFSVDQYQQDHPDTGDKAAILAVLEGSKSFQALSEDEQYEKLRSLEVALSRTRTRRSQKP